MRILIKLGDTPEERAIQLVKTHKVLIKDMDGTQLCEAIYLGNSEANAMLKEFQFDEDGIKSIARKLELIISDGTNEAVVDGFYDMDEMGNPGTFMFFKNLKANQFEESPAVKVTEPAPKTITEQISELVLSKGNGRVVGIELPNIPVEHIDDVSKVISNSHHVGNLGFIGKIDNYYLFNTGAADELSWLDTNNPLLHFSDNYDMYPYNHITLFNGDGTVDKRIQVGGEGVAPKLLDNRFGVKISSSIPIDGRLMEGHDYTIIKQSGAFVSDVRYSKRHSMDGSIYLFAVHDPRVLPFESNERLFIHLGDNKQPIPIDSYYLEVDEPSPKLVSIKEESNREEPTMQPLTKEAPVEQEEQVDTTTAEVEAEEQQEEQVDTTTAEVETEEQQEEQVDTTTAEVETEEQQEEQVDTTETTKPLFGDTMYAFTDKAMVEEQYVGKPMKEAEILDAVNVGVFKFKDLSRLVDMGWIMKMNPEPIKLTFTTFDDSGATIGTQEVDIIPGKGVTISFNGEFERHLEGDELSAFMVKIHETLQRLGK